MGVAWFSDHSRTRSKSVQVIWINLMLETVFFNCPGLSNKTALKKRMSAEFGKGRTTLRAMRTLLELYEFGSMFLFTVRSSVTAFIHGFVYGVWDDCWKVESIVCTLISYSTGQRPANRFPQFYDLDSLSHENWNQLKQWQLLGGPIEWMGYDKSSEVSKFMVKK